MNSAGWIKIHRSILDWEWYSDTSVTRLFLHFLFKASFNDKLWQGRMIKRGQLVCSLQSLAVELNLSKQQVRTAISKLESTGEIEKSITHQYTVITVCKYDSYQSEKKDSNTLATHESTHEQHTTTPVVIDDQAINTQTSTHESTTSKEVLRIKKKEKIYKKEKFRAPTIEEVKAYFEENGYREDVAVKCFRYYELGKWTDSRGNQVKAWKQKIFANWFKPENKTTENQPRRLSL